MIIIIIIIIIIIVLFFVLCRTFVFVYLLYIHYGVSIGPMLLSLQVNKLVLN